MTYGLRPWELDGLTRREWVSICDDWMQRQKEVQDGAF